MKNTLYISDLDGTLLSSEAKLTSFAIEKINDLIENGMQFTAATARTASTAVKSIEGLKLELPVIFMNGVAIYDTKRNSYASTVNIGEEQKQQILSILDEMQIPAFVYSVHNEVLFCYAPPFLNEEMQAFRKNREENYNKVFTDIKAYSELFDDTIMYFTLVGQEEKLLPIVEKIRQIEGVDALFYEDVYTDDWFLEIYNEEVSKGIAARWIKEHIHAHELVVFGDNLNDIPMLIESDYAYAVSNAKPEVKAHAQEIIASNDEDAVVKTLEYLFTNDRPCNE